MYFSLAALTTLGFGDIILGKPYRLMAALLIKFFCSLHIAQSGNVSGV